ncbi:MAG: hypothetical protein P8076_06375 [Gammaproteobacteria bacterium]
MPAPKINTAIPKRRYAFGSFTAVLLGEIDSGDQRAYRHILALVAQGQSEPCLYVTCERTSGQERARGGYILRQVDGAGERVMGIADQWKDLETFAAEALRLAQAALGLTDETPVRLA